MISALSPHNFMEIRKLSPLYSTAILLRQIPFFRHKKPSSFTSWPTVSPYERYKVGPPFTIAFSW